MILAELTYKEITQQLAHKGLAVKVGRFNSLIKMPSIPSLVKPFCKLYQDSLVLDEKEFIDFSVSLTLTPGLRSFIKPQVNFDFCGLTPFEPLPADQALPFLEWGMNWCVSQHYHDCLIIHAAVVEKEGKAIILPGLPGAGKSTLCAGLVNLGGWRLLSDELTLIDITSGKILPNPRPISLKNQSIEVIENLCPDLFRSSTVKDTAKGEVSLFQAPRDSIEKLHESVDAKFIVFPRYIANAPFELSKLTKGRTFIELANQSFNYSTLGEAGFEAISKLMNTVDCYELIYDGDLHNVTQELEKLVLA